MTTSKFCVEFDGKKIETTVTNKAAVANEWASEMLVKYAEIEADAAKAWQKAMDVKYYGNETEFIQSMMSKFGGQEIAVGLDCGYGSNNKLSTLQLCIGDKCLILQLIYLDEIPQTVKTFLSFPKFIFVGIEVSKHVHDLRHGYGLQCYLNNDIGDSGETILKCRKGCDPGQASGSSGGLVPLNCCEDAKKRKAGMFSHPEGLKDLAIEFCNLRLPNLQHVRQSNWDAEVLNEIQVGYACINTYASYKIGALIFSSCTAAA